MVLDLFNKKKHFTYRQFLISIIVIKIFVNKEDDLWRDAAETFDKVNTLFLPFWPSRISWTWNCGIRNHEDSGNSEISRNQNFKAKSLTCVFWFGKKMQEMKWSDRVGLKKNLSLNYTLIHFKYDWFTL